MFHGTTIDDLLELVARAEERAREVQLASSEPVNVPAFVPAMYEVYTQAEPALVGVA